jgi:DNA-binding NarL/FixJ family response regulator
MATRILLADDHTLMRQGLRQILEQNSSYEVIAEANSGLEAVELAEKHRPDLAIIDVGMKELNGIEATAQILKHCPHTVVLILSMYSDERYVIRAIKAGARGIQQVQRGNAYFSPVVAKIFQESHGRLAEVGNAADRYELLTERERQIYQLLAEGNSNKDIANRLNLSLHTIETHRWRVMEKMNLHSTAELVLSAVRRGLVT